MTRSPFHVQSDALDPEVEAELEAAADEQRVVWYEGTPWLVQKLENHADPGTGAVIRRYTLIPAEEPEETDAGG